MLDADKTKEQLIAELRVLRARVAELESGNTEPDETEGLPRAFRDRFYTVLSSLYTGVLLVTEAGRVEFANNSFCSLFNLQCSPEELKGLSASEIIDRVQSAYADPASAIKRVQEIVGEDLPVRSEEVALRDGRMYLRDFIPLDIAGKRFGRLWHHQDITERKRAEEKLRVSGAKYRSLLENMMDGFVSVDLNGNLQEFNRAFQEMLGYTKEELLGLTYLDLTPECWHDFETDIMKSQVLAKGYSDIYEKEYWHRDGRAFPVELRTYLIRDDDGRPAGYWAIVRDITERKTAEKMLRESEEKYRKIFESAMEGIFQTTLEGRCLSVNPAFTRMFGFSSPEEMIGLVSHIGEQLYVNPKDRDLMIQMLERYDKVEQYEIEVYRKDGNKFWISVNVHAVRDADGSILYIEGTNTDITERVQQHLEIKLLNRLYSVLSQVSQAVMRAKSPESFLEETCRVIAEVGDFLLSWIGCVDAQTSRVVPSAVWGEAKDYAGGITVYADDRPEGRGPTGSCIRERRYFVYNDFLHDQHTRPWHERAARFGLKSAAAFPIEFEGRAWGALTLYSGQVGFFGDEDLKLLEKVAGVIGFGLDNLSRENRRRQAEKDLRESEERFQSLFSNMAEGVAMHELILDESGRPVDYRIVDVNPRYTELIGLEPTQVRGKSASEVYGTGEPPCLAEFSKVALSGIPSQLEVHLGPIGKYFEVSIAPWGDKGFATIFSDVTSRKQAEENQKRLEARLQRAEKMEALGTLAGGVAHDLNNVLGIVVGYSDLLLDVLDESDSARSQAMEIHKGGRRAAAIVQDLLTLARRGVQNRKVLNLNNIVLECVKSPQFANMISTHGGIEIKLDCEADLLNLSGSSVHLEKTILNLLANAVEAIQGEGALTIKTRNQYLDKPVSGYDEIKEGDYVVLSVSDTGEGIPVSDLKHIFEPFYTKKVMGRSGTGLGLAVVWGTVKDHRGYIDVVSLEGEGTSFIVYFPVTREDAYPEKVSISVAKYMGKGEAILIIDDVREQRELAALMLTRLNYRVIAVSSGEQAVDYLRRHTADLLILDMIMEPGMDGLETYSKILEFRPRQKAIIVSGFSETERVAGAQALGAGAYVKKPYVLEKLGLAVREELDRK